MNGENTRTARTASDEKNGLLRFERIGYRVDEKGELKPLDREVQDDFSKFIREVIAAGKSSPAPR